jgi:hypothetical protein
MQNLVLGSANDGLALPLPLANKVEQYREQNTGCAADYCFKNGRIRQPSPDNRAQDKADK